MVAFKRGRRLKESDLIVNIPVISDGSMTPKL